MAKKILLVINDPGIKEAFARAMADVSEDEGVEVVCVEDGRAALFQLNEILPDLFIAEIASGEKNGFVLCRYARQEPEFEGMRVLLLDDEENPVRENVSYDVGADAYLARPFREQELVRVIRRLIGIEEKSEVAEPVITGHTRVLHQAPHPKGYTVTHPQFFNSGEQYSAPGPSPIAKVKTDVLPKAPPSRLKAQVFRPRYVAPVALLLALAGFFLVMRLYAPGSFTGQKQTQPSELGSGRVAGAGAGAIDTPTQTAAYKTASAETRLEPSGGDSSAATGGGGVVRGVHAAPSRSVTGSSEVGVRGTAAANSSAGANDDGATPAAGARPALSNDRARPQSAHARPGATSLRPSTAASHLKRSGREMKQAGKHLAGGVKHFGLSGAKVAGKAGKKVGNAFKKIF